MKEANKLAASIDYRDCLVSIIASAFCRVYKFICSKKFMFSLMKICFSYCKFEKLIAVVYVPLIIPFCIDKTLLS